VINEIKKWLKSQQWIIIIRCGKNAIGESQQTNVFGWWLVFGVAGGGMEGCEKGRGLIGRRGNGGGAPPHQRCRRRENDTQPMGNGDGWMEL
jgi:hypothetical protein